MPTACFFSGFNENSGFSADIAKSLKKEMIRQDSLVCIASSPALYEKNDYYFHKFIFWFNHINLFFKDYFLIDTRTNKSLAKNKFHLPPLFF